MRKRQDCDYDKRNIPLLICAQPDRLSWNVLLPGNLINQYPEKHLFLTIIKFQANSWFISKHYTQINIFLAQGDQHTVYLGRNYNMSIYSGLYIMFIWFHHGIYLL